LNIANAGIRGMLRFRELGRNDWTSPPSLRAVSEARPFMLQESTRNEALADEASRYNDAEPRGAETPPHPSAPR
jgi:hypothetical protein